jgi:hypothetical protein
MKTYKNMINKETYITHSQAKFFKEKRFNQEVEYFYSKYGEINYLKPYRDYEHLYSNSKKIESYFTGEYDWNSLNLGEEKVCLKTAFEECDEWYDCECSAPEQDDITKWLKNNHGIWIFVLPQHLSSVDYRNDSKYPYHALFYAIIKYNEDLTFEEIVNTSDNTKNTFLHFETEEEAYSLAFDYIINNNLI